MTTATDRAEIPFVELVEGLCKHCGTPLTKRSQRRFCSILCTNRSKAFLTELERFWANVNKSGECWTWTASKNQSGYGQFRSAVGNSASRFSYMLIHGPIPRTNDHGVRLHIDHLCRNRACVNPDHLELVTDRENVLRGEGLTAINARKTHCIRGHEFSPTNTYWRGPANSQRMCRTCNNQQSKRRSRFTQLGAITA